VGLTRIFLGLDREANRYCARSIENLEDMIAPPATKFAGGPLYGNQFKATVAGSTFGADDVRFSHPPTMRIGFPFSIKKKFRELSGIIDVPQC
jgi:hypothetical protein